MMLRPQNDTVRIYLSILFYVRTKDVWITTLHLETQISVRGLQLDLQPYCTTNTSLVDEEDLVQKGCNSFALSTPMVSTCNHRINIDF